MIVVPPRAPPPRPSRPLPFRRHRPRRDRSRDRRSRMPAALMSTWSSSLGPGSPTDRRPAEPGAVPDRVAAQRQPADPAGVQPGPCVQVTPFPWHRAAVPQTLSAGQTDVPRNDSQGGHRVAAVRAMSEMNNRSRRPAMCWSGSPRVRWIAGDLASDIGNGRGPVDEDLVLGVTLIADGRQPGVGQEVGPNPPGRARRSPSRRSRRCRPSV